MPEVCSQRWEYKFLIGSADGSVSIDHLRSTTPVGQLLEFLAAQGWHLVGQSEASGPVGVDVTYILRRPA